MTTLFSPAARNDPTPKRRDESTHAFLERVDDPWFGRVRDVLEGWVADIADDVERDRLLRDLQLDQTAWTAALWELFLHTVLVRTADSVVIHPLIAGRSTTPDFLVGTAEPFYVEATISSGSKMMAGQESRLRDFVEGLRWLNEHDVIPEVTVKAVGPRALSARHIRRQLEETIARLVPGRYGLAAAQVDDRGWNIQVALSRSPSPLPSDVFTRAISRVGIETLEDRMLKPLRRALKEKGSTVSRLDRPAFIAVLLDDPRPVPDHFLDQVLFGRELHRIAPDGKGGVADLGIERRTDGFFGTGSAPKYRNVAGVIVGQGFGDHNLASPTICTKLNPWGRTVPFDWPWEVHEYSPDTLQRVVHAPTTSLGAVTGVPADMFELDRPFERWNFERTGLSRREWADRIAERVRESIAPSKVVLFGSVARGEDTDESDVDILVVVPSLRPEDKPKLVSTLKAATADIPVPKDFVVADEREVAELGDVVGSAVYWPVQEGIDLYERAA